MSADILAAAGLAKSYGDAPAVGPVDLHVAAGERVVLVGHNGSGKTTLLRMAAGLLEPSAGRVTVDGRDVGSVEARALTSYLADQPVFYDDLSVWEHLEFIARLHDTEAWDEDAADLLDLLGLTERADDLPTTFSRGLRQKAAIALAFVRPFELLLVDEPFVGLDLEGRTALLTLFDRAHANGATLVVATHELTTVAASGRVVALRDGVVVHDGPAGDTDVEALVTR
ncbi:MAG: ABC transporter ATP-binding protein [Actinomycetota bacterium]|nr:ABC transporter ATP-binding protein [Acidimicrobiia bacterium]MDQ3468729.1 ABC transporter ATP-binding protein [Actinomycetota bacterium]